VTGRGRKWAGRRLLVLYRILPGAARATVSDHVEAFRRYSGAKCVYVNLARQKVPAWLQSARFDGVILHTTLLSARWAPSVFWKLAAELSFLGAWDALKIALPQDEFIHTESLCEFLRAIGTHHIFSVAPESEWPTIYAGLDRSTVRIDRVLTGYLEPATLRRIERLAKRVSRRSIDIGYRAYGQRFSLGEHGQMKIKIAQEVEKRIEHKRLTADISTRAEDTLLKDDWYRFLLECRYTIGVEGGASVHDPRGSIRAQTLQYVSEHPEASFEDVRGICFPGEEGSMALYALSPRHLEACATRTCQLLVVGDFNGILEPDRHYIPLRRDLGDLDNVLNELDDEERRLEIVHRAHQDIVESGEYSYESFVRFVLDRAVEGREDLLSTSSRVATGILVARARMEEAVPRGLAKRLVRGMVSAGRWTLRMAPRPFRPSLRRAARALLALLKQETHQQKRGRTKQ